MIAIVSSNAAERDAFGGLCESRAWPYYGCDSLRAFRALLHHTQPTVVLVRHALADGYSDDVLAIARESGMKSIVLLAAGTPGAKEARQVALGADCVHRDPARIDVVLEYLARYRESSGQRPRSRAATPDQAFAFAGASISPGDRMARRARRAVRLTPREVQLAELLFDHRDAMVSYHVLYASLLGRKFEGDTSNMRVLFGKLGRSLAGLKIDLRQWVEVIPKAGYRYRPAGGHAPR